MEPTLNALSAILSKLSLTLVALAATSATYSVTPIPAPKLPQAAFSSQEAWIRSEAPKYGVNPNFASCIVSHESQFRNRDGDEGHSRGYWQINNIWHPEVSDAVAHSLESSTDWSLGWIAKGHAKEWSTFGLYCSSTKTFIN